MLYSTFSWHYEDLMMYSINYMHKGGSKVWYAIPASLRKHFDRAAKEKLATLYAEDPNFLFDITLQISPSYLTKKGITVYRGEQKPGEFIVTFPESYHSGFSTGFNIAEACNFAIESWVPYGKMCSKIYEVSRE